MFACRDMSPRTSCGDIFSDKIIFCNFGSFSDCTSPLAASLPPVQGKLYFQCLSTRRGRGYPFSLVPGTFKRGRGTRWSLVPGSPGLRRRGVPQSAPKTEVPSPPPVQDQVKGTPSPHSDRTRHRQDTARGVCLLRFHARGLPSFFLNIFSCVIKTEK